MRSFLAGCEQPVADRWLMVMLLFLSGLAYLAVEKAFRK